MLGGGHSAPCACPQVPGIMGARLLFLATSLVALTSSRGGRAVDEEFAPPLPGWVPGAVYVRSYKDSDGDGVGDFKGLREQIPYIKALGVDGYLPTDFMKAASEYGGDEGFDLLAADMARAGLRLVLDLPFSMLSAEHPWFASANSSMPPPEALSHFLVHPGQPCPQTKPLFLPNGWSPLGPGTACYYSSYFPIAPAVNVSLAHCPYYDPTPALKYILSPAANNFYQGASGFRLDSAAGMAPLDPAHPPLKYQSNTNATHEFWTSFMRALGQAHPGEGAFAIAELWGDNAPYYQDGIQVTFEGPIWLALATAWQGGSRQALDQVVQGEVAARPPGTTGAVFLGNHDVPASFPTVVPKNAGRTPDVLCPLPCNQADSIRRLQSSALLLFSLPGIPFVYYGEEIGLHGARRPPFAYLPNNNTRLWGKNPMQWDQQSVPGRGFTNGTTAPWAPFSPDPASVSGQLGQKGSVLETYKGLIGVRKTAPALLGGLFRPVSTRSPSHYAFLRYTASQVMLVAVDLQGSQSNVSLDLSSAGVNHATASEYIFKHKLPDISPENCHDYVLPLQAFGGLWVELNTTSLLEL
eukprot:gene7677-1372_t